jgi:hypothetical protein
MANPPYFLGVFSKKKLFFFISVLKKGGYIRKKIFFYEYDPLSGFGRIEHSPA